MAETVATSPKIPAKPCLFFEQRWKRETFGIEDSVRLLMTLVSGQADRLTLTAISLTTILSIISFVEPTTLCSMISTRSDCGYNGQQTARTYSRLCGPPNIPKKELALWQHLYYVTEVGAGGWQWQEVAALLRSASHDVFTPTFTGLGERVHLTSPDVDLNTYIQDLTVLKYENLADVVLLGYSISGPVITGVAEKASERIGHLVYLDAYVLDDGQSMADQVGAEIYGWFRTGSPTVWRRFGVFRTTHQMPTGVPTNRLNQS